MGPAADGAGRREDMERRDAVHDLGMWGNFFTSTDRGIDVTENRRQYNFFSGNYVVQIRRIFPPVKIAKFPGTG